MLLSFGCLLRSRTPLLAPTFTVLRNAPSRSRPRTIERLDLHRTKPTYIPLLPRVVEVGSLCLKLGRTPCVLAGLWFRAMRRHALLPHDVSDSVASSLSTSAIRNRDCLTAFNVSQWRFPKWFRWADVVAVLFILFVGFGESL